MEQNTLNELLTALAANEEENKVLRAKITEAQNTPEIVNKFVGQHFKFIDYEEEDKPFYVYCKVLGLTQPGTAMVIRFDDDPSGRFYYGSNSEMALKILTEQITADEYNAAAQRALARLKF